MMDFLLRLFNIKATGAGRISDTAVEFHGADPAYVFVAALVLGALVVWMYRRAAEDLSAPRKYALACLRAIFLLLILGLLLRPVLTVTFEHMVRRTVLVLLDTSSSMSEIKDQRTDENDLKRVAIVRNLLDPAKGLAQPMTPAATPPAQVPRIDVVKAALTNPRIDLLRRLARDYDLAAFTFDKGLTEIIPASYKAAVEEGRQDAIVVDDPQINLRWVDKLQAQGTMTAIGDALREVISRKRGQPLAGILLVTDGASNSGYQPLDAAKLAAQDKAPLYIWGVGITSPKDIIVGSSIFAPEVAFAKDEVPVTVRVRSIGMTGQSATLIVKLGQEKAEKPVFFNADGEQVVTVNLTPKTKGQFIIEASIPPREDEVVKDNNSASQHIRVVDDKIKVLMVEQSPRWEFKYLQAILSRDRRVEFKCVLLEGDPSIARGADTPYLEEFPRKKDDLFKYDLVILGDVDPKTFAPDQLDMLGQFVSRFAGAVVMVAGKRYSPHAYRKTIIEKMLPVELESADSSAAAPAVRPVRPELTAAGKTSLMLRLAERDLDSIARWEQLPPLYWVAKVARAKPAAEVLAVDPDLSKSSRYGKMPLLAIQQYGMGQVLYVGTDNLWRWRKNAGDRYHSMLWGQIVQRMALPHLLGASKRTQLTSDQKEYASGSKVTIYARLYTEAFDPMAEPTVKGSCVNAADQLPPRDVQLRAIPDQPGMYRGELVASAAGVHQFSVDHDKNTKLEFTVIEPKRELAETAMNESLLKQMASASEGPAQSQDPKSEHFFREETLYSIPDKIKEKAERKRSTLTVEMWSSPIYFLLMLGVVTAEWILRKVSQLK